MLSGVDAGGHLEGVVNRNARGVPGTAVVGRATLSLAACPVQGCQGIAIL